MVAYFLTFPTQPYSRALYGFPGVPRFSTVLGIYRVFIKYLSKFLIFFFFKISTWKKQNLKIHLPVNQQSSPHLSFSDSHFQTESQRANQGSKSVSSSTGLPLPVSSLNLPPGDKHPLMLRSPAGEGSGVSGLELNPIRWQDGTLKIGWNYSKKMLNLKSALSLLTALAFTWHWPLISTLVPIDRGSSVELVLYVSDSASNQCPLKPVYILRL